MCGLPKDLPRRMVEVVLCPEGDVVRVHGEAFRLVFAYLLAQVVDRVAACLIAVEAVGTLRLFKHDVFRCEFLVVDVGEELNAELHVAVHCEIQIRVVLPSEPVWVLLA